MSIWESERLASRPVARRRYAPKTKSGCATCKIRRIKCDEEKPFCKRCTSTGRKCDGYGEPKSASATPSPPESIEMALTLDVVSDRLEKRTFDFFRSKTVPGISGYFRDSTWNHTVLQVSHSEPAVRFAVNALGALHEELFLRKRARQEGLALTTDCRTNFPIKQYTKAIKEVQKLLERDEVPLEVVLLCSMAFMHFESLHQSFLPALLHLENAIRLLKQRKAANGKSIDDGITQAMVRLDVQASVYLGMRIPGLSYYEGDLPQSLPPGFLNVTHARDVVDVSTCRLLHFVRTAADDYKFREPGDVPIELYAQAQEFEQTFLDLDQLLLKFMQTMKNRLTLREQQGVDLLRSRVKMNRITAACCMHAEQSAADVFQEQFEEILTLCNYKLCTEDLDSSLYSASLDEGLVYPLLFVASGCRDSRTRHQALSQLKKIPAREGIWYMEVMAQTAEVQIRYEEALCDKESPTCKDIPEWRRVHGSGLRGWDVSAPRTTAEVHLRTRPNGMDGDWCDAQEPIEFLNMVKGSDVDDFCNTSVPALTAAYPFFPNPSGPPALQWSLHAESLMSTLPFHTRMPQTSSMPPVSGVLGSPPW